MSPEEAQAMVSALWKRLLHVTEEFRSEGVLITISPASSGVARAGSGAVARSRYSACSGSAVLIVERAQEPTANTVSWVRSGCGAGRARRPG